MNYTPQSKDTQQLETKKKKKYPTVCSIQKTHCRFKDTHKLKVKKLEKVFHANVHERRKTKVYFKSQTVHKCQIRILYNNKRINSPRRYTNYK